MKIKLTNKIEIITDDETKNEIIKQFTFANPKYAEAEKFGRSVYSLDENIGLVDEEDLGLIAPMGILNYLLEHYAPEIIDNRNTNKQKIPFTGNLRPYQVQFVKDAIQQKGGQMVAATGSGKTVCGIAMASKLKQRTLILVKNKDLAKQWQVEIKQHTGLDAGMIGGGKSLEGKEFTIGLT